MGTLAVLDRVTIKVMPAPAKTRSVLVFGLDPARAVQAMAMLLRIYIHLPEFCDQARGEVAR
jgi:FAD/FMN-containing dehydrogenase